MTPLDIKKQVFTQKWRGYEPAQVQAFLETVAREFDELNRQNAQLQEKLKNSEERIYQYRLIEKTLQDTAVTLQQTLEEKRRTAEQESDLILQQARQRAEAETGAIRERADSLRSEISALENQRQQFFLRLKNLLEAQSQALEAMRESDPAPPV